MSSPPRPLDDEQAQVEREVLRDLVDATIQEGLAPVSPPDVDGGWGTVGTLQVRLHDGGALQRWRAVSGEARRADGTSVPLGDVVAALGLAGPGAGALVRDLRAAAEHAAVVRRGLVAAVDRAPAPVGLLDGERWTAVRGRPFHPTARAVSGWSADEVARFGATRAEPLACAWVAVARDRLRLGPGADSDRLHERIVTGDRDRHRLRDALARAGVGEDSHQILPVHPWHSEHVLGARFAEEVASGEVVPLDARAGRLHPTSSIRTLVVADTPTTHLKLPLGVATLGATRLLPPRYLDNGDRAERVLRRVIGADPVLRELVDVCDEGTWAGWTSGDDEFEDRPGHLAAQLRRYPAASPSAGPETTVDLPMGALAADAWSDLGPALEVDDPLEFFGRIADAFLAMLVGFLARGVLPEVHGQNVVARIPRRGTTTFVLRDHDTLRIQPGWMATAGIEEPGYRIRPGARQSLRLDSPDDLVGYAQTLGLQVNLHAIADSLARHHGLDEGEFWGRVRSAVTRALEQRRSAPETVGTIERLVLAAPTWPSRTLVGPLLAQGPSGSVSMPAGVGAVPNPLLPSRGVRR